jgi:aerobic-type carbon monoxide dehydrogenase small subunit (CoxS/CutS family)
MSEEEKNKSDKLESGNLSRREFLRDAGLVAGGATIGSLAILSACGTPATETVTSTATKTVTGPGNTQTVTTTVQGGTPGATTTKTVTVTATGPAVTTTKIAESAVVTPTIKLTVNKWKCEVQVAPEDTLHYVLREKLGITSIKDMCTGYGACGSCTIIVDGRPILSCLMLAIHCDGANIETAEGLADANHPLIDAYIQNYGMQCGYCTPGFILTAKALLDKNKKPTEADIREALGGNICRCGTYPAHIPAVLAAAAKL